MEQRVMTLAELINKFKTKQHFVEACRQNGKLAPSDLHFSWDYVRQIMSGQKKLIDLQEVESVQIPPRFLHQTEGHARQVALGRAPPG